MERINYTQIDEVEAEIRRKISELGPVYRIKYEGGVITPWLIMKIVDAADRARGITAQPIGEEG